MGRRSHTRTLGLWMNGTRVGTWSLAPNAPDILQYELAWTQSGQGRPLSLSLPFTPGNAPHRGAKVRAYFENLLPDSKEIRERLARRFNTGSTGAFELLAEIGRDCVGALEILPEDAPSLGTSPLQAEVLSEAQVAQILRGTTTSSALGWRDGSEFLGAWRNVDENAGLPPEVFGQLCERGVLSMRFCIGNIGGAETVFRETLRHAAVVPSMQELLASAEALVRPRHRVEVARALRAVAELDGSQAARAKFGEFQGSALGERYPEIVQQWDEALSRSEAFYALDAPLRELVRSADRMAADVSECLTRAIKRHGQFSDSATALDFVVACLEKAERGLDRDRAAALATGRARLSFRRSAASAPGVARGLTPA